MIMLVVFVVKFSCELCVRELEPKEGKRESERKKEIDISPFPVAYETHGWYSRKNMTLLVTDGWWPFMYTLCRNLSNKQEKKEWIYSLWSNCVRLTLAVRVIYEISETERKRMKKKRVKERERDREKDSYCTIGQYSRSSNLWELVICICTCFSTDISYNRQVFSRLYNQQSLYRHTMNMFGEVSYRK